MVMVSPSEIIPHMMKSQYIAVDTEGWGIGTAIKDGSAYTTGLSVACRPPGNPGEREKYSTYVAYEHEKDNSPVEIQEAMRRIISMHPRVVMHNAPHDIPALEYLDIPLTKKFYCTMHMFHWLYEQYRWSKYGLDFCSEKWLKKPGKAKGPEFVFWLDAVGWGRKFPVRAITPYACQDAETTLELFEYIYPKFKREGFDGSH